MNTIKKQIPWYFTPAVVIVAGCLVAIVNFGVRSSFGLFTAPISEAHAWPRDLFLRPCLQNLLGHCHTNRRSLGGLRAAPPAC
jgi:hypothetical protein